MDFLIAHVYGFEPFADSSPESSNPGWPSVLARVSGPEIVARNRQRQSQRIPGPIDSTGVPPERCDCRLLFSPTLGQSYFCETIATPFAALAIVLLAVGVRFPSASMLN